MTPTLVCPKCRGSVARTNSTATHLDCPKCGARLRLKPAATPEPARPKAAPAPPEPKPRKKKKSKKPFQLSGGVIAALAGGALLVGTCLIGGVVGLVWLGGSKPGGPGGAGEFVVVDSPPAGAEAPAPAPAPASAPAVVPPKPPEYPFEKQPTGPAKLVRPQGDPPKRPAATPVARDGVVARKPEPPAEWTVPPAAAPDPTVPVGVTIPDRLLAMADTKAAAVRFTLIDEGDRSPTQVRCSMAWVRYDRKTGQPLGEPIPLWPPVEKYWLSAYERSHPFAVALTRDGQRLALLDPAEPTRVDVWDAGGQRLFGMVPYPDYAVEGVAWLDDGRLLTVGQGKLTAWEVPAGKAVFEIDGQYAGPIQLEPGRRWLVAATYPGHVDVLATDMGACLGRCSADNFGYRWDHTLLSPDGTRLVRALPVLSLGLAVWDLKTGQLTTRMTGDYKGALVWCDEHRSVATERFQTRERL